MKKLLYILGLASIVLLGIYARLEGIFAGTFGFTHDQGRDLLAAYSIAHGDFTLIGPTTGLLGVFHGPLWHWLLAVLSFLGQGNPKFIIGSIIFIFLAAELFLFFTILKFYGKFAAFIFLALVSISPFFISSNGQLWSPSMILVSMMLIVSAVIGIIHGKKWFWLLGFSLGANAQFEAAGGIFILLAAIFTFLIFKIPKLKISDLLITILSFGVTLLPQVLFEIRHGFWMTKLVLSYLGVRKVDPIAEYGVRTVEYKTGLFFDNFYELFFRENIVLTLVFILTLFFLVTKIKKFTPKSKVFITWSFSMLFFLWLIVNFYFDVVWHHFLFGASILFLLVVVFILDNARRYAAFLTYSVLAVAFVLITIPLVKNLNKQKGIVGDHSYFRNQLNIVDTIYSDAGQEPFNVEVYEPTTFSYTYDYLFKWYGAKKYGQLPTANETHVKTTYFIIEPDSIAGRREKWVTERDGDGVVVWEKEYWKRKDATTGLTLQKRIRNNL